MAHTKELSKIDMMKEAIHQHVHENSWLNIIVWDNWVLGLADSEEQAKSWHDANSDPRPEYWAAWTFDSAEEAAEMKTYFHQIGLPSEGTEMYESTGDSKTLYLYKAWF